MKKILSIFLLTMLLCACSDSLIEKPQILMEVSRGEKNSHNHEITEERAIEIAKNFFQEEYGQDFENYTITKINRTNKSLSRSLNGNDILTYILNRGEGDGFILISPDDRVNPVFAYSDTGTFSYEESPLDPVYSNFITRLEPYLDNIPEDAPSYLDNNDEDLSNLWTVRTGMLIRNNWHQWEPFNVKVDLLHPGHPVGCVAIALGQIIANSREVLENYHGIDWNFSSIIESVTGTDSLGQPIYSPQALDSIQEFLVYLSDDLHMDYRIPRRSAASRFDAFNLANSLGFNVQENAFIPFSAVDMVWKLYDMNVIYADGQNETEEGGRHSWVIDSCRFKIDDEHLLDIIPTYDHVNGPPEISHIYLHCNWGWRTNAGYYHGEIFETTHGIYNINTIEYFSVEQEYIW